MVTLKYAVKKQGFVHETHPTVEAAVTAAKANKKLDPGFPITIIDPGKSALREMIDALPGPGAEPRRCKLKKDDPTDAV